MEKCCFITGHRPNRFHFLEQDPMCQKVKNAIESEIKRLYQEEDIRGVWVGGAAGVDTWAGEIVLALQAQTEYHDLKLYLAIPFPNFDTNFTPKQKKRYQRILAACSDSVIVCNAYRPDAYKQRNYYMVDHSLCGIAVYAPEQSVRSGTKMTINYATKKKMLPVTLIHPNTVQVITKNG